MTKLEPWQEEHNRTTKPFAEDPARKVGGMTIDDVLAGRAQTCVVHGDCLEVMRTMPAGCVDAVVTDPPYGVNYEYNAFDDSPENFERLVRIGLPEIRRVCAGPILWFGSSPRMARDLALFDAPPQRTIIWSPKFTLSRTGCHGMFYKWHPCYCWNLPTKPEASPMPFDITDDACEGRNWWDHPATKPVTLMRKLVGFSSDNAIVLDPFCGSGTTGVACVQTGRRFIGIEISEEYVQIARRRIADAAPLFVRPTPPPDPMLIPEAAP